MYKCGQRFASRPENTFLVVSRVEQIIFCLFVQDTHPNHVLSLKACCQKTYSPLNHSLAANWYFTRKKSTFCMLSRDEKKKDESICLEAFPVDGGRLSDCNDRPFCLSRNVRQNTPSNELRSVHTKDDSEIYNKNYIYVHTKRSDYFSAISSAFLNARAL